MNSSFVNSYSAWNHGRAAVRRCFNRALVCLFVLAIVICGVMPSVAAASAAAKKGFVEYQTEGTVNFYDIIEVILTDEESGYSYTHYLYKNNDYTANIAIPLGVYSVEAKVITETTADISDCFVICPEESVVVEDESLAVAIPLRIETATNVEASDDDYSIDIDEYVEPAGEQDTSVIYTPVTPTEEQAQADVQGKEDGSLLGSTLFYLGLVAAVGVAYLLWKRKMNRND